MREETAKSILKASIAGYEKIAEDFAKSRTYFWNVFYTGIDTSQKLINLAIEKSITVKRESGQSNFLIICRRI